MKDLLSFRKMITPVIIQFLFWLVVLGSVAMFAIHLFHKEYSMALQFVLLPLVARVVAEVTLVVFQIYNTLIRISEKDTL